MNVSKSIQTVSTAALSRNGKKACLMKMTCPWKCAQLSGGVEHMQLPLLSPSVAATQSMRLERSEPHHTRRLRVLHEYMLRTRLVQASSLSWKTAPAQPDINTHSSIETPSLSFHEHEGLDTVLAKQVWRHRLFQAESCQFNCGSFRTTCVTHFTNMRAPWHTFQWS